MDVSRLKIKHIKIGLCVFVLTTSSACSLLPTRSEKSSLQTSQIPSRARSSELKSFIEADRAPSAIEPVIPDVDQSTVQAQADYHFALAEAFSQEFNSSRAIEEYKLALLYDPNSAMINMRLGMEYVKKGLISESLQHVEKSVQLNGKIPESRLLLAGLYSTMKLSDKAIAEYKKAIELKPQAVDAYLFLSAHYVELKKDELALRVFNQISTSQEIETPHIGHYYAGRLYQERKEDKKAEQEFLKALAMKADYPEAVVALGGLYEKQNKTKQAMAVYQKYQDRYGPNEKVADPYSRLLITQEDYKKALEQLEAIATKDPSNLNAKVRISLILIDQKDFENAVTYLKDVLELAPDSDKIRFYLAIVLEEIKDSVGSLEQFSKITPDSSYFEEATVHMAQILRQEKMLDLAIQKVTTAFEQKKTSERLILLAASLYEEKTSFKQALSWLEKGIDLDPKNDQLYFFSGTILDKLNRKEEMVIAMNKAIHLNPENYQALNYLAYSFAELNRDLEQAQALAMKAATLKPKDPFIQDTLGWVYYKQGEYEKAIVHLEKAHRMNPTEGLIADHLGDAYAHMQLTQKAREMYMKAVKMTLDENQKEQLFSKIEALQKIHELGDSRSPASTAPSP